jgi:ketosteroid isomerase-like protein
MYKTIVASQVRKAYRHISAGNFDHVLKSFHPDVRFQMMGDHHLGDERRGVDQAREWFAEVGRLFPDLRIEPLTVIVSGWPWDTRIATRFRVTSGLEGNRHYENEGMQFLRLRWGKAVEDRLFEDTQVLEEAIEHQRSALGAAVRLR